MKIKFPMEKAAVTAGLISILTLLFESTLFAEQKQDVTVVQSKKGLHFKVPPDWPIEERNGAVGPIPVEEYLAMKFSAFEKHRRTMEEQLISLDLRVRFLEEELRKQKELRSQERSP